MSQSAASPTPASPRSRIDDSPSLGRVSVLLGDDGGHYPHGNSVLVRGSDTTVLVDPSLMVAQWGSMPIDIDVALLSHVHEDHVAGLVSVPDAEVHVHWRDQQALRSLDDLVDSYGLDPAAEPAMRRLLEDDFHFVPRSDALPFDDGDRLEVGGSVITAVHLPGHTPGHCGFVIEPEGVFVLGDIDLTGFGPYYADAGSDLDAFDRSLERCAEIDARWFVTYHHKGIIDGREPFLAALATYRAAIGRRDDALLAMLDRPRTLAELVSMRLLYRPHVELIWVTSAERRTIGFHLARLVAGGAVRAGSDGRFHQV